MGNFKSYLNDFVTKLGINYSVKEVLEYCHVVMCFSANCSTCTTHLIMTVTQLKIV